MLIRKTLDGQLAKRPQTVVFCKKCVVSNQRPRIVIHDDGVCSACHFWEEKQNKINWAEREEMLLELLARHRSKGGSYDCVVPGSGGKDSAFVAHQLKYKYGMHPLTVTWAPFMYTDIGWTNYVNFKDAGFDNLLCFPDGNLHRKLCRLCFELLGAPFEPFGYGQKAYAFHIAAKFKIPLIFYGESGEIEYGGSVKNKDKPYEDIEDWKELYYKGTGANEIIREGFEAGYVTKEEMENNRFVFYNAPGPEEIRAVGIQMHWFSFYKKWVPQENYYYAAEHTGFKANPDGRSEGTYSKYASLDDKVDGFHWYLGHIKFGMGRASRDSQMETRAGHITREEAMALVKRYDGEFPKKYYPEFLSYLGISDKEFREVIDFYRELSPHLWRQVNGEWSLRHTVNKDGVDD